MHFLYAPLAAAAAARGNKMVPTSIKYPIKKRKNKDPMLNPIIPQVLPALKFWIPV